MIHRSLKPLFLQHPIPKQSPFVLALHAALAASQRTQIRNVGRITTTNHNYTMKSASGVATWHKCLERSPGVIHYCKFFGCKWKKDIAATSCYELPRVARMFSLQPIHCPSQIWHFSISFMDIFSRWMPCPSRISPHFISLRLHRFHSSGFWCVLLVPDVATPNR